MLLGHLRNLATAGRTGQRFLVLHHAGNRDLKCDLGDNVEWIECAGAGSGWLRRSMWELLFAHRVLRRLGADVVLSLSGSLMPGVRLPQVVLAQNPWCFFPQFHLSISERVKAALQRFGYRRAQRSAEAVFYLSDYLASEYSDNARAPARAGGTLHVGVAEELFSAPMAPKRFDQRDIDVLTVSVMTRHKAIEDVIDSLQLLHAREIMATLWLVGPWSEPDYRAEIEARVRSAGLSQFVTITGGVSEASLHEHYGRAKVFCLLSRCESFGIPAIEAQTFGTPCVVADACAPPEIAGPGGIVAPLGDIEAAADALARLVCDEAAWTKASAAASSNAQRFRWSEVSQPIVRYFARREPGRAE